MKVGQTVPSRFQCHRRDWKGCCSLHKHHHPGSATGEGVAVSEHGYEACRSCNSEAVLAQHVSLADDKKLGYDSYAFVGYSESGIQVLLK